MVQINNRIVNSIQKEVQVVRGENILREKLAVWLKNRHDKKRLIGRFFRLWGPDACPSRLKNTPQNEKVSNLHKIFVLGVSFILNMMGMGS